MSPSATPTYEDILKMAENLTRSPDNEGRAVTWLLEPQVIGISRNFRGQIEIFISGDRLVPSLRIVRENLEYETWHRKLGDSFQSNRLLLPTATHFDSVAAFICVELIREKVVTNAQKAMMKTEPLIALALERFLVADSFLLGLVGELTLLCELLRLASKGDRDVLANAWYGSSQSARDFQLPTLGVEVKTTTADDSSHSVSGVHQVELGHGVNGQLEDELLLVSIGLVQAPHENQGLLDLPTLVDEIIKLLLESPNGDAEDLAGVFKQKVSQYGAGNGMGYDHDTMRFRERFKRKYAIGFVRGYSLTDPQIQVLTSSNVRAAQHVELESVKFRINLPKKVSGDINPKVGLINVANQILKSSRIIS